MSSNTMSTSIFTAQEYDPRKARRRWQWIAAIVCVAVIVGGLYFMFRNWTYEHRIDKFFAVLQQKDYKQAYALWMNDPDWEKHPAQYKQYPYSEFYQDWGPGGEWGLIKTFHVEGSLRPKNGSGVIVYVKVNDRIDPAKLWVEKKDKTITWAPPWYY
jgi:hypothetical protein